VTTRREHVLHVRNPTCSQCSTTRREINYGYIAQADGQYSPGCTVYSETWRRCDRIVDLFVEKRVFFIVFLIRLRLVLGLGLINLPKVCLWTARVCLSTTLRWPDRCWLRSKAAIQTSHRRHLRAGRRTRIGPESPIRRKIGRPAVPVIPPPWLHASQNRAKRHFGSPVQLDH